MVVTSWVVRSSQAEMYGRHKLGSTVVTGGDVPSLQAEMYGRHRRRCMVVTGGDVWSSQAEMYRRYRWRCMVVTGGDVPSLQVEMYGRDRRRCTVVTGGDVWSSQAEMYGRYRRRCMVVTGGDGRRQRRCMVVTGGDVWSSQAEMYGRHRRRCMVVTGGDVWSSQAEMYGRHRRRCMVVTGGDVWSSQAEMYGRHRRRCMVVTGGDVWSSQAEMYGRHRRRCMVVTGGEVSSVHGCLRRRCMVVTGGEVSSLQAEMYGRDRWRCTVVTGGDVWSSQAEKYRRQSWGSTVFTSGVVQSSQAEMYVRQSWGSTVVIGGVVRSSQAEMCGRHRRRCMVVTGGVVRSSQAEMFGRHRRGSMVVTGGVVWSSQVLISLAVRRASGSRPVFFPHHGLGAICGSIVRNLTKDSRIIIGPPFMAAAGVWHNTRPPPQYSLSALHLVRRNLTQPPVQSSFHPARQTATKMATLEDRVETLESNMNIMFLVTMGIIVFLMQGGFALLEAGSVRSKNTSNILIKNLLDAFVSGIAYWTIGYALAYGGGNEFIAWHKWASDGMPYSDLAGFFFQYVFAATAATIVSGALAERCEFIAYFVYSFFITAFIYPVATHWAWDPEGWLNKGYNYSIDGEGVTVAYKDFAGSGVLHCLSGVAALVGAAILGPRLGRYHSETGTVLPIRGHSVPFAALGGFILLFGFLAFNGGSQGSISGPEDGAVVSLSIVNTIISGSTGAFVTLIIHRVGILGDTWSLLYTLNGALGGMVSICAGCNMIRPWVAAIVGLIGGIFFNVTSWGMTKLHVDDPLDAVAVHLGAGIWGVINVALFHYEDGIFYNWDKASGLFLGWQIIGLVSIIAWTAVLCTIMFGSLRLLGIFRVSEEIERKGLDIPKHGEPAYPLESYGHGYTESILTMTDSGQLSNLKQGYPGYASVNKGMTPEEGSYESPEMKTMHYNASSVAISPVTQPQPVGNQPEESIRFIRGNTVMLDQYVTNPSLKTSSVFSRQQMVSLRSTCPGHHSKDFTTGVFGKSF
ncbi:hypothetical protein RRG08_045094 [Elysia crispata]|uniref:Ammonium transporter AmtB-like domain-containing protein n=1 Tax=Elysia crispata TaxID=231223 RepID=A0AAE0YSS7_9GAST|nr:hypothetical protein RRG08_045094 [Elysia crispata]